MQSINSLATITNIELLKKSLFEAVGMAVESIQRMAAIVKRLTELDVDVTEMGLGISPARRDTLINIANGTTEAEVYAKLGHKPSVLKLVATLPKVDQIRIANGEPITVLLSHHDGDYLQVAPDMLTPKQLKQVFDENGGLRSKMGQLAWLGSQRSVSHERQPEVSETLFGRGFVEFTGPTKKTVAELLEIVQRLTAKAK